MVHMLSVHDIKVHIKGHKYTGQFKVQIVQCNIMLIIHMPVM